MMPIKKILPAACLALMLLAGKSRVALTADAAATSTAMANPKPGASETTTLVLTLETPPYSITQDEKGFDVIRVEDFAFLGAPGDPLLPHGIYNVALPPDIAWESLTLEAVVLKSTDLEGTFHIAPAPPPAIWIDDHQISDWGENAEHIVDGRNVLVYENDAYFPDHYVDVLAHSQMRKWKFVKLAYIPVQYNPVTGKLRVATRVEVRLSFTALARLGEVSCSDTVMEDVAEQMLFNYAQANAWYGVDMPRLSSTTTTTYAIITTNAIEAGSTKLANFIAHKQSQGYNVLTITEDEYGGLTGQSPNGTAEKIRQWLIDNYASQSIEYVLLIGDPDPDDPSDGGDSVGDVPMKMCWPRSNEATYRESPTDYFFADLTGNWDLDGDGYFGEYYGDRGAGGVDFANEVYVGRIPVYGADYSTLDNILQKTIDYETEPQGSIGWRESALLPMSFSDGSTDGAYLGEAMKDDYLTPKGYSTWTMYQQGSLCVAANSGFSSDQELYGNTAVRDRWAANHYGIVTWWGHGNNTAACFGYSGCGWGTLFANTQASSLDDDHPSFVYQCSCNNGYPEDTNNLGYELLKQGGIGTVSASRVSWYAVTSWFTGLKYLCDNASIGYYYDQQLVDNERPAAKALYVVKADMGANQYTYWEGAHWMNLFGFNLYGDPATSLVSAHEADLAIAKTVTPSTAMPGQAITYTITYTNSGPDLATSVLITDAAPISVTNVSYASSGATITPTGGISYTWQVGDLALGEGGVITITGVLSTGLPAGAFTNTATITTTAETDASNNTGAATVAVDVPIAGLSVASDSPTALGSVTTLTATIAAGSNVTYTWALGDGESGSGAVVSHTYPAVDTYTAVVTASNSVSVVTATTTVIVRTPGVKINAGAEYAASTAVTLTLQAPFTATQMRLGHDGSAWNDWEDYAATRDWTLQSGDGTKAVYAQFYGDSQYSDVYSDTIVLDTTPPAVTVAIAAGAYAVNTTTVTATVAGTDATP